MQIPMYGRFTHKSRIGRGKIPTKMRDEVYLRDNYTCAYCATKFPGIILTIDHLIPLSRGGLDEITNYVTCCGNCNTKKRNLPLPEFANGINIKIETLPIHGDPVLNNADIPVQIRMVRKAVLTGFDEESSRRPALLHKRK
jgi:hypothetical protein